MHPIYLFLGCRPAMVNKDVHNTENENKGYRKNVLRYITPPYATLHKFRQRTYQRTLEFAADQSARVHESAVRTHLMMRGRSG